MGLNYQPSDRFDFNTTAFFNIVKDKTILKNLIEASATVRDWATVRPLITRALIFNTEKAEIYGLEISFKYQIIAERDMKAAYTFTEFERSKGENKGYATRVND